jgi:hypothetical protein
VSVALFEQSAHYAIEGLSGITGSDLGRPTPSTRWDLRVTARLARMRGKFFSYLR